MIQSVSIRNFKCLRSVDVDLEPLTVLIGKNDTGKSSFLEAISLLHQALGNSPASKKSLLASQLTYGANEKDLSISVRIDDENFTVKWHTAVGGFGSNRGSSPQFPLKNIQPPYRLDPDTLRKPAQVGALSGPLPPKGDHLVAAIDRLPMSRMNELQKQLRERVNSINEVVFEYPSTGSKAVYFDLATGGRVGAKDVSDGVMLLLAFLTIMHDEHAPSLIMVEEPENGIHPKQLEYVVKQLHSLTQRDKPIQVILTTHSPYVLDFVPKESVRVFARDDSGDVVVKPFADIEGVSDMLSSGFTLGEAWYNSDEDELVREHGGSGGA